MKPRTLFHHAHGHKTWPQIFLDFPRDLVHFTSLSRIYLSRIVEKVPKNLSSYAPDQDEGNKQQCN